MGCHAYGRDDSQYCIECKPLPPQPADQEYPVRIREMIYKLRADPEFVDVLNEMVEWIESMEE